MTLETSKHGAPASTGTTDRAKNATHGSAPGRSPVGDNASSDAVVVAAAAAAAVTSADALRLSEERYRSLVIATSSIVWVTDSEGKFVDECPSWTAFTGQSFEEYKDRGWLEAIHPDDREYARRAWSDTLAARKLYEAEYRLGHRDGSWRHMLVRGAPVADAAGRLREWVGTSTDISDRVRVEEALREEIRITDILHSMGMAVAAELDLHKLVQQVTDAATKVTRATFGAFLYNVADPGGARFALGSVSGIPQEAFAVTALTSAAGLFQPIIAGQGVVRIDDLTKDPRSRQEAPFRGMTPPIRSCLAVPVISRTRAVIGGLFFGHTDAGAFSARDERIVRGIASQAAIAIDNARLVSDLRDVQQNLARQLEFTRSIAVSLGEGLYAVDAGGRATFVNPAAERLLGWKQEELLGRDMHEVVHFQHADKPAVPREACELTAVVHTGNVRHVHEDAFTRRDGSIIPVSYTSSPTMEDGRIVGAVVAFHDITQRKAAEEVLRRSNEQLEQLVNERTIELQQANAQLQLSNRELEDFASVASHDLQEPLRKIQAFGDRLEAKAGAALGDEGQDYLRRMRNAAGRMQTLISDLLQFSRVTTRAQPFVPVDLKQVSSEVLVDLETRIDQTGGRVELAELTVIDADPTQMRQLLQNLIGNALKFRKPDVAPVVKVLAEVDEAAGLCRLCVADNGIGFDEKYLDRIFNVFQRLHGRGSYEGTGIGLAVCRKIAERHGGSITAQSAPDVGSTFIVTLPLRQHRTEDANGK